MNAVPRRANKLFSDLLMPDETLRVREEVRAFCEKEIAPVSHRLNTTPESKDGFARREMDLMAKAGLYEIPYAADVGGRGLKYPTLATATVCEELGYWSPSLTSSLYDGQAILVGKTLDNAPDAIRMEWLPKLVRGEFVGCFATSEPDASTDLSPVSLQTIAEPVNGGFKINGMKRWITNSPAGDVILVLCRTGESLTMLLADMHDPGITVSAPDLKMGNHVQLTADVSFKDVFVPEKNVVGKVGGGLRTAIGALVLGRMGIGAIGVAMAQRAFDIAVHYMTQRKVFGKELAKMQHWQYRFAEHALAIEQARNLYQKAAMRYDTERDADVEAAMCKVAGSRLAVDVARDAIQVCGAYGFVRRLSGPGEDYPLESIYRDAKIGEIYEGANEIQTWVVARHIFGREHTG